MGLDHLDPESLHIKRWGLIAEGTSFTRKFTKGQVLFGKRRAYQRKAAVAEFGGHSRPAPNGATWPTTNSPSRPSTSSTVSPRFCGYRDNDDALQLGYSWLLLIDFRSELPFCCLFAKGSANDAPLAEPTFQQAWVEHPDRAHRCPYVLADGSYDHLAFFAFVLHQLKAIAVVTKNPRNATDPKADLATDTLALFRRPGPMHQILFNSRRAVERTNSRTKLLFNLKYHQHRGWEAVRRCCLLATLAMLTVA